MIKYKKKVRYELERYPSNCKECPCFKTQKYRNMNEIGTIAGCELGYMDGLDTRDFSGDIKCPFCNIKNDTRVIIFT